MKCVVSIALCLSALSAARDHRIPGGAQHRGHRLREDVLARALAAATLEYFPHGVVVLRKAVPSLLQRFLVRDLLRDEVRYAPRYQAGEDPYRKPGEMTARSLALLQWDYYKRPARDELGVYPSVREAQRMGQAALDELGRRVRLDLWRHSVGNSGPMGRAEDFAFPYGANMASFLALAYREDDETPWHFDLAGTQGWVLSATIGASSLLQYMVADKTSLAFFATLRGQTPRGKIHNTWLDNGDLVMFHGGHLLHRVGNTTRAPEPWLGELIAMHQNSSRQYTRLPMGVQRVNLQIRPFSCEVGLRQNPFARDDVACLHHSF